MELAARTGGRLLYRAHTRTRRGLRGRLLGPHVAQAWRAAAAVEPGDTLFADGEHIGLPLLAALRLRRRRPARLVMLGHLPGRRWKLALFRALTRGGAPGIVVVHSVEQARLLRSALGRGWRVQLLPYQVDTAFWRTDAAAHAPAAGAAAGAEPPRILAAGSEHRDYETLVRAVDGLPAHVVIAAGSHWARTVAQAAALPANVEYYDRPLPFAELREQYARATAVVVPLHPVTNQSGVTTMLEAMSMARPLVVTASPGQREVVRGPLVDARGTLVGQLDDHAATVDVVGAALDETATGQRVEAVRHGGGADHRRPDQLRGAQFVRRLGAAEGRQHVELPARQPGAVEGARPQSREPVRDAPESRHDIEGGEVDVGEPTRPGVDEEIHLVVAVRGSHTSTVMPLTAQRRPSARGLRRPD